MTLYVVILVCSASLSRGECTPQTARAFQAFRAPEGIIVCGGPTMMMTTSPVGPNQSEYVRVKCVLR